MKMLHFMKLQDGGNLSQLQTTSMAAIAVVMIWLAANLNSAEAQYDSHQGGGYGGGGGYDERPKVQLGIRLKIPAIKFELPRFNMPKITVSAKIRQPDRPRVINLPEINLDSTSNKQVNDNPMGGFGGGGGGYKGNYNNQEQTFSFSTHQEEPKYQQQHYYEQSHVQEQQAAYASNEAYARHPAPQQQQQHQDGGLKLSSPLYIRPQDRQQPIEAYGRMPIKAMAFYHPKSLDFLRHPQQQELHEVLVNRRRVEPLEVATSTNGHRFFPSNDSE